MSDALELVLGKLDGVRQSGGSWMARCPAHDDSEASLSIRQGTEQPVILHCHGGDGCEPAAILGKIGLSLADISTPRAERQAGEWTPAGPAIAVYSYVSDRGKLLFQVCRTADKKFRQRRPDPSAKSGWSWKLDGVRRVPYRLPEVRRAIRDKQTIYIAEGEKDVHALEAAGAVATCNPGGAGKWLAEYTKLLSGARSVVIIGDKDDPGRKHADKVARSLGRRGSGVSGITIVEAAEGKDAADHLAAGLGLDDFLPVQLESDTPDSGERRVSEISGSLTSDNDTSNTSDTVLYGIRDGGWLDAQQFPPLRYTVPGLMPAGLGLIAGPPKAGKSLLILDWLLAVALGGMVLGKLTVGAPRDVLYLALEDGDRRLQSRCRHLLADGEPIPDRLRYVLAVPPGQVLAVITDALDEHPETGLIVIDTLGRIMPLPMQGETTYQRDYRVAVALKRIADEHPGLTIIVVHHTRKAFSEDFIDSISGTHGLAGAADTIIAVSRSRGKHEGVLRVTGRDVIESEYAVLFRGGAWMLDGADLKEARANVARRADDASLSGRSAEIIDFVRGFGSGGATAKQVTEKFGGDAAQYLKRHAEAGRLAKPKRGLYVVSEPSGVSEDQVSDSAETDTPMLSVSEVSEETGWPAGSYGEDPGGES